MKRGSTRRRIAGAADRLFYERGFDATSFADIAAAVGISRGNFYHHFKSKDEILQAVIDLRLETTSDMLTRWEAERGDPAGRILCFVNILIANRARIVLRGCPVGTLTTELAKLDHAALGRASDVFSIFRDWLRRQFVALGRDDADALAMHVLGRSQGAATLASAFHDEAILRTEVESLTAWLAGLDRTAA